VAFFLEIASYALVVPRSSTSATANGSSPSVDVELSGERANEVDCFTVRDSLIVAASTSVTLRC